MYILKTVGDWIFFVIYSSMIFLLNEMNIFWKYETSNVHIGLKIWCVKILSDGFAFFLSAS